MYRHWIRAVGILGFTCGLLGCDSFFEPPPDEEFQPFPVRILATHTVVEVQASGIHACARTDEDETWCWGGNEHGAIGATTTGSCGTFPCSRVPQLVSDVPFRQLAVSHMASRTCALDASGAPWCWGFLVGEQEGVWPPVSSTTPQRKSGTLSFERLVMEAYRNCGLRSGELWCWGHSSDGDFGDGAASTTAQDPLRIADSLDITDVDIGWVHSCLLTRDGLPACWGNSWYGVLGDILPFGSKVRNPLAISGAPSFTQIVVGSAYSCGLTAAGVTYCWGSLPASGSEGEARFVPTPLTGAPRFTRIFGGTMHACGLTAASELYCWGENDFGQLGDGTTVSRTSPVRVPLPAPVIQVSDHPSCAVTTDGALYCWGFNGVGQLAR